MGKSDFDCIVVGGGVIGLSVAFEWRRTDGKSPSRCAVLDQSRLGQGASYAAAGMIAPQSEAEVQSREVVDFGLHSAQMYTDFVSEVERVSGHNAGYSRAGTLWVAADPDDRNVLDHLRLIQEQKGVTSKLLTASQVTELEPHLSSRIAGGLHMNVDHQVDPRSLISSLERALRRQEVVLREQHRVRAIKPSDGGWCIQGESSGGPFEITAPNVVVATGAWTELEAPVPWPKVRPIKGQAVRLGALRDEAPLLKRVIRSPRVYLVPNADGTLMIGATSEEKGLDNIPTAGAVMDLLRLAFRLLPGIYELPFEEVVVGHRPALADHKPAVGNMGAPGLFVALGHYRDGVLLAPATAKALVHEMRTGHPPSELAPFSPRRLL